MKKLWGISVIMVLISSFPLALSLRSPDADRVWMPFITGEGQNPIVEATTLLESTDFDKLTEQQGSVTVTFWLQGLYIARDISSGKSTLEIPGGSQFLIPGAPIIPEYKIGLALPPKAKLDFLETVIDEQVILSSIELPGYVPKANTPHGFKSMPCEELPTSGPYPGELTRFFTNTANGGYSNGTLILYPVQSDPQRKECIIHKKLQLVIHFTYQGYSEKELKEITMSKVLQRAQHKYGNIPKLERGQRRIVHELLKSSTRGDTYKNSYLVEENGSNEFTLIGMSNWFESRSTYTKRKAYGVMPVKLYDHLDTAIRSSHYKTPAEIRQKFTQELAEKYGKRSDISSTYSILPLVEQEWEKSPGVLLFKKSDLIIAAALTPLASYLNWPLVGIDSSSDLGRLSVLLNKLGCRYLVTAGVIANEIDSNILPIYRTVTPLVLKDADDINELFLLQKSKDKIMKDLYASRTGISLAGRAVNHDFTLSMRVLSYSPSPNYLVLYSSYKPHEHDVDYSSAAAMLAAYRAGNIVDVSGKTPSEIRSIISQYSSVGGELYIALMGDGDSGEVTCDLINDPIDDDTADDYEPGGISGNGIITTDFYYEASLGEGLVGTLPDTWEVSRYVGRVVGNNEWTTKRYVEVIKQYEMGLCSSAKRENSLVTSVEPSWDAPSVDISNYFAQIGKMDHNVGLYAANSTYYSDPNLFSRAKYLEKIDPLYYGVTLSYVNSHGYPTEFFTSDNDWVTYFDIEGGDLSIAPFFQFTDACLTGLFMSEVITQIPSANNQSLVDWNPDESINLGVNYISSGGLGYVGATMISYLFHSDEMARSFFADYLLQYNYTLGQAMAFARKSYYQSSGKSDIDKKTVWEMILIGDPAINPQVDVEQPPTVNHVPQLTSPAVSPEIGDTTSSYTFSVHFYDQDGDSPDADISGSYQNLTCEITGPNGYDNVFYFPALDTNNPSNKPWNGTYTFTRGLPYAGTYQFKYVAYDGHGGQAETAWVTKPTVIGGGSATYNLGLIADPNPVREELSTQIVATLIDQNGTPAQGKSITLYTDYPPGINYTGETDVNGQVKKYFVPSDPGLAVITASSETGQEKNVMLTVNGIMGAASGTIYIRNDTPGSIYHIEAVLTVGGQPIYGKTVMLTTSRGVFYDEHGTLHGTTYTDMTDGVGAIGQGSGNRIDLVVSGYTGYIVIQFACPEYSYTTATTFLCSASPISDQLPLYLVKTFSLPNRAFALAWSYDGSQLFAGTYSSGGTTQYLYSWTTSDWTQKFLKTNLNHYAEKLAAKPDNTLVAVGESGGGIELVDFNGTQLGLKNDQSSDIDGLDWVGSNVVALVDNYIPTAGHAVVSMTQAGVYSLIKDYFGYAAPSSNLRYNSTVNKFAYSIEDGGTIHTVRLLLHNGSNPASYQEKTLFTDGANVNSVDFSPSGDKLVIVGNFQGLIILDTNSLSTYQITSDTTYFDFVRYLGSSGYVAAADNQTAEVKVFDLAGNIVWNPSLTGIIESMDWCEAKKLLALGFRDGTLQIYGYDTSSPDINNVLVSPDIYSAGTIFTITCDLSDSQSGMKETSAKAVIRDSSNNIFQEIPLVLGSGDSYSGQWDSSNVGVGTYFIGIYAEDNSGNYSENKTVRTLSFQNVHTISGYIRLLSGAGINGVLMNGLPNNPATDGNGYYDDTVPHGWSGTATPTKTGYSFNPASTTYTNVVGNQTADYTGTSATVTISGYARTLQGDGVIDVIMNGLQGPPKTDASGYYSSTVTQGWSGTVTPTKAGYSFSPINKEYANVMTSLVDQNYQVSSVVTVPQVTTTAITSITLNAAVSGGNVTSDGGATVTARGVCWSPSANPTIADSHTTDGSGTGSYTSNVTGLSANTVYHVRAYATNSGGTVYGSDLQFTTSAAVTIPKLSWNTFLGGESMDYSQTIAVDTHGNTYITGYCSTTWGSPVRDYSGDWDIFVAKLDKNGALQWNTFLGGQGYDAGMGIALDTNENVYVVGYCDATWGSPIRDFTGSYDAFVAKLDGNGMLQWNTFLGGEGRVYGTGIVLNTGESIYVVGNSTTTWGSPIREYSGGVDDAFVAKLGGNGILQWNTFLGGTGNDTGFGIAADISGNVYGTGTSTVSWGSPVIGFVGGAGNFNAYVVKLDVNGILQWNTFLGSGFDQGFGIAADMSGGIFVIGWSWAAWGVPVRAFTNGGDGYLAKLDTNGTLKWNTFLGGTGEDEAYGIAVDMSGSAYVTGRSLATWGSPSAGFVGSKDAYVAKVDGTGALLWNTFLGSGADEGYGIACDTKKNIYVIGMSPAVWGSPVRSYSGDIDVFVAKINNGIRVDFNKDGQEDLLWRCYGAGYRQGDNVVWYMNQTGTLSPMTLGGSQNMAGTMNLLTARTPAQTYVNPIDVGNSKTAGPRKSYASPMDVGDSRSAGPGRSYVSPMDVGNPFAAGQKKLMRGAVDSRRLPSLGNSTQIRGRDLKGNPVLQYAGKLAGGGIGTLALAYSDANLYTVLDTAWEIAGAGDFDGDGNTDILWRYYGAGQGQGTTIIWYMTGTTISRQGYPYQVSDTDWRIDRTGDFNGDGKADILWRYYGSGGGQGTAIIWYMDGANVISSVYLPWVSDTDWKIDGIGDFNGDGKADLLWRYYRIGEGQGTTIIWYMDGITVIGQDRPYLISDTDWRVDGTGDFDGDGKADIVWRYYGTVDAPGTTIIWYMNGATIKGQDRPYRVPDTNWRIVNR